MQGLQIDRRLRRCGATPKKVSRSLTELPFPLGNLIGMHFESLGQFGQGLIAANATLALNTAECVRRVRFAIVCSISSPCQGINGSRFST